MDLAILGVVIDPSRAKAGGKQAEAAFDSLKAKAKQSIATIDSHVEALGRSTFNIRNAIIGLGASFAAVKGVNTFGEFERTMARIAAVTGASRSELKLLSDAALSFRGEMGAREAALAMKELAQAGLTTNQVLAAVPATIDLAVAADLDLKRAAEVTKNVMEAFGMGADETRKIIDVMASTANHTATDINAMGEAFKYVAPITNALGISIEQTSAAIGILANNGIQGSMAGTSLKAMIASLASPTNVARQALQSLGLEVRDVNPQTNSLTKIINTLALAGMDAGRAFDIFTERASPAVMALVSKAPHFTKLAEELKHTEGAGKKMADTIHNSLVGDLKTFTSTVEAAAISTAEGGLGGALRYCVQQATALTGAAFGLLDPLDKTNRGAYELAENVKILGAVAAGFVAAKLAFHLISIGAAAVTAARAIGGLNFIISANPIGMLAVGIGLATAALIAHNVATSHAEREQKAYNTTLEQARKLAKEGRDASEAALKASITDVSQRANIAETEIRSLEKQIATQEKLAAAEKERVDADMLADERGRRVHRRPERDKLSELKSQLHQTKAAYAGLVDARQQQEQQLTDIQLESLARSAGVSLEMEKQYQDMRAKIIANVGDPEKQAKMLEELDKRFQKLKENKPVEIVEDSELVKFARTLDTVGAKMKNFELLESNLKQAVEARLITQAEANEVLLFARQGLDATPLQRYVDGLDTAAAHTKQFTIQKTILTEALARGKISLQDYNLTLANMNRELADAGRIQQFVDGLDIQESRLKRALRQQELLNEARAAGKLTDQGYAEAIRLVNDELARTRDLTQDSAASLTKELTNFRNSAGQRVRISEEMNRRLQDGHMTQTEAFKAGVAQQVESWGNANQQMAGMGRNFVTSMEGHFLNFTDALVDDISQVGSAFKNLIAMVLREMARMVMAQAVARPLLNAFFMALASFGGSAIGASAGTGAAASSTAVGQTWGGQTMQVPTMHTGGIAGSDATSARNVPLGIFAGARRYHSSGIVGSGEVPIIAKRGEGVFTPEQMRALGGGSGGGTVITVHQQITVNKDGSTSSNTSGEGNDGQMMKRLTDFMDTRTRQIVLDMARPGGPLYTKGR